MDMLAFAALAALAAVADPASSSASAPPAFPAGLIELEGRPLRVAALQRPGGTDVLLLDDRELERFRLEGRTLARTGAFRASKGSRPLLLDAASDPAGGATRVAVVFGEDFHAVDQGTDTRLHAHVLSAGDDGGLRPASDDLRAYLRITGGKVVLQRRGTSELVNGPVHPVEEAGGRYAASRAVLPWGERWLLEATPLPGGMEALAWEDGHPIVVKVQGGTRVSGGTMLGDLGEVEEPRIAIRVERPMFKGLDAEARTLDLTHPLPRRVSVGTDGAAYTVDRQRSRRLLGKTTGNDAIVRVDWSGGALTLSRPFPAVEAFIIDFALIERPGGRPVALLLLNEKEDGSGRAHLLFQEAR